MFILLFSKVQAQCPTMFPVFSMNYDCLTAQATVVYSVSGGQAPYTCTLVSTVNSATVATGSATTPVNSGGNTVYTGTTNSVPVGNYNVFITAANGCTTSTTFQVIVPFSSANVIFTPTHVSCYGGSNGAVFASTNSGQLVPPFTFTWAPTGPPQQTTQTATGLTAGVYTVTVKDSKGCTLSNTVSLTQPAQISSSLANTLVPCYGGTVSSVVTTTGGTSPFTYSVNGTAIQGSLAANLAAGTVTLTTKDGNNCSITNTIQISQVSAPVISFNITPPFCPGSANGAVTASVSNAPPVVSYTWSPVVSFTNSLNNIPAGNYTLTIKDGSACITRSVVVVAPAISMSVAITSQPENCSAQDGTVGINVTGGNFPYSYTTIPAPGPHTSNTLTGLSSGSYTTVIKDANSCIDTVRYALGNLSTVSLSVSGFTPVNCYNQCTGAVQLSVQNAVAPVTFSATGSPTTTSNPIQNLCAGFYIIKAVDNIGCPATVTVNFPVPPVFIYSANAPSAVCFGNTVSLSGSASGGNAGSYTYNWNPGNLTGQTVVVSPSASTVYSLNVYDGNGCTLQAYTVNISVADPLAININASSSGICPGTTAQITPTISGGDGNYSYSWMPGNITTSSIFVQNITIPVYTLTVNDGCGSPAAVKIVTINLFPVTIPTYTVSKVSGCEPLCVTFINTTPKASQVIWNYGDKPIEQQGLTTSYCYDKAGTFSLKISLRDSNNCNSSFTYSQAIKVLKKPSADFITDPGIITLDNSENVIFKNISADGDIYKWYRDGAEFASEKDIAMTFEDTGCVKVVLIAANINNCRDTIEKDICVLEGFRCWVPNCFTPNNDSYNEVLLPKGTGWDTSGYLFEVYNRWGSRIFSTRDVNEGWDGKAGDKLYDPSNVYYWRIAVTDIVGTSHVLQGHVLLLR